MNRLYSRLEHNSTPSRGGQRVRFHRSENLADWEDWQAMTLGGNATGCGLIDATTAARQRFYRVVEDKPTPTDKP